METAALRRIRGGVRGALTAVRRIFGRKLVVAAVAFVAVVWAGWRVFRASVGSPEALLDDTDWLFATRVLARDGQILGERPSTDGLRGVRTKLEDVSPRLVRATVASEDRRFFEHDGVDRSAILRALFVDMQHARIVSGGSTITQQLVKRLDHQGRPRPRTMAEKLREIARAENLEAARDKNTILEAYLNRLDYGRGFAGPEAAALGYFGVHARDLSLAQAAFLAVLPRAPSALDPYRHRDRAVRRQRALLTTMRDRHDISEEDFQRAMGEELVLEDAHTRRPLLAPHLVLAKAKGSKDGTARGVYEVRTTLDADLQRDAEALVRTHAARLAKKGASTAAVVVVDNATGDVLASIGSADYGDATIAGAFDIARARRQPGSALKPFVYAMAFERGVSPMQVLADVPTEFGDDGHPYAPENFDGGFVGPVSAREALAGSLNVPAVRLTSEIGAANVVERLRASGLSLAGGAKRLGLSVVLGSGEVSPLELAAAYATLARGGVHRPLREDASAPPGGETRVFEAPAIAAISDALSDPFARIRGLRTRGPFEFPYPVAIKTGTSTGYRDAWTAGYTRERTVVVWVGNANGAPTNRLTGAVGAGPLFFDVMTRAMRDVAVRRPLVDPEELDDAEVCPLSGERAGPACPDHVRRKFPHGHAPTKTCSMHRWATARPAPPNEPQVRCDARGTKRIVVLPEAFSSWLDRQPLGAPGNDVREIPWFSRARVPGCDDFDGDEPRIVVVHPQDGAVFEAGRSANQTTDALDVRVETTGLPREEPLEVLVDGRVSSRLDATYRAQIPIERGDHWIEVRPTNTRRAVLLGRSRVSVR